MTVAMNTRRVGRSARLSVAIAVLLVVGAFGVAVVLRAAQTPPPSVPSARATLADLERAFRTPPDDARIMMRWWWFGPAVTKAGLEREMRLMKEGGIGGFEIQPVYPVVLDDPARGIVTMPFLSDAFLDHLHFAAAKARELGLRADLTLGSGWPYGGPQVGITQAAGKLRVERIAVPAGIQRVPVPDIRAGERLMAAFLAPTAAPVNDGRASGGRRPSQTTCCMLPDRAPHRARGAVLHQQPHGHDGEASRGRRRGLRPEPLRSDGARPLPEDRRRTTVSAFDGAPPYAVFCDSLEVYESDWTDDFLEAFKARRGYDLRPLLPALLLDAGAVDRGHPPRLGPDAHRVAERALPGADAGVGPAARHALPHPGLRHSARDNLEQRRRRSARGRRLAVEDASRLAMGGLHRPPLQPAGHLLRDVDVAAFAGVQGHAPRRQGRGGSPLPPGDQPAHRPRLAVHGRRRGVPGLAVLRGRGVQREEPLVDRDARPRTLPPARQFPAAPGPAGQRRRPVPAD